MSGTTPLNTEQMLLNLNTRTRRLSIATIILALLLIVLAAAAAFALQRKLSKLEKAQKDLAFSLFNDEMTNSQDFVEPTVNTIQFLRRGYSISFDKVEYNQNGLFLSGQVGNTTNLWISSLALNFSARPYPYKIRDKWEKENESGGSGPWMIWWSSDWDIGTAQTTVGSLNPGSTAYFSVTVPNVKQTSDNIQIAVSFSGERYQYLGR